MKNRFKKVVPLFYTLNDTEEYDFQAFYDFAFNQLSIVYYHVKYGFIVEHEKIDYCYVEGLTDDLYEPLDLEKYDTNELVYKYITVYTDKGKKVNKIKTLKSMMGFEDIRSIAIYLGLNVYNSFEGFTYDDVYTEKGVIL